MGVIIGIDFGLKRCGLAVSDELKMIGTPLKTVGNHEIYHALREMKDSMDVEGFVVGLPKGLKGEDTDATAAVHKFLKKLKATFPDQRVWTQDERFTSRIAQKSLIEGNLPRNKRREKGMVDKVSACIILQSFLDSPGT